MKTNNLKIKQLVQKCDEIDAEIISYSIKRLFEDWDILTYVAIIKKGDHELIQTLVYDNKLEQWN